MIQAQFPELSLHKPFLMKQVLVFFVALLFLSSCHRITGSGNIISEKRVTGGFTGIKTSSGIDVELRKIKAMAGCQVEAKQALIAHQKTA